MASTASFRLLAEFFPSSGVDPSSRVDTDVSPGLPLALTGFTGFAQITRTVAPAADDEALTLPTGGVIALLIVSDEPITLKLETGETAMANGRAWMFVAADEDTAILPAGDLLLTGNGASTANVVIWYIPKP